MPKRNPIERFVEKFEIGEIPEGFDSPCYNWTASLKGRGYLIGWGHGQFWNGAKLVGAHQFSWKTFVGFVPKGLELDHLCKNKVCVNPDHLEPVTHRENQIRAGCGRPEIGDLHRNKTHCPQGHEYAGENLRLEYNKKTGVTSRKCRICGNRRAKEYGRRNRRKCL